MNSKIRNRTFAVTLATIAATSAMAFTGIYALLTMDGSLRPGEKDTYYVTLRPGTYEASALANRGDLDMVVYGANGAKLGEDILEDNYPIVEFRVTREQRVKIVVNNYEGVSDTASYEGELVRK